MRQHFFFHRLLLTTLLLTVFGLQNCKKDVNAPISELPLDFASVQRNSDPLSEQACNEVVPDEYESHGKFIYEHLRYYQGTVSPDQYIAEGSRETYVQSLQNLSLASADKTAPQLINEYYAEGLLSQDARALLLQFHSLVTAQENEDLTFGQAWYLVRNWEIQTIANTEIPTDDKQLALLSATVLRNMMKYAYETGGIAEDRDNNCFLGRKMSCWTDAIVKSVLDALIKAFVSTVGSEGNFWSNLLKAAWKLSGPALVANVVSIYLKADCRCDSGNEGTTCEAPKGISIFPGDCNPLEQTFRAWGHSAPAGTAFNWVVSGGVFPENNNSNSITTLLPEVRVRQNNPNVPVTLGVRLSCEPTPILYFTPPPFSIPALVNSPGTVQVWGPKEVIKGGYHYKYEFWGSWRNSLNSVLFYSGCTSHGQVVETGVDYIKVQWTSNQPVYPVPRVTGIVKNLCSDASLTAIQDVIVY